MADVQLTTRRKRVAVASTEASIAPASPPASTGALRIFKLPTVAEVVAAGYPASKWLAVKRQHAEFVRRYTEDSTFRTEAERRFAEDNAARTKYEAEAAEYIANASASQPKPQEG